MNRFYDVSRMVARKVRILSTVLCLAVVILPLPGQFNQKASFAQDNTEVISGDLAARIRAGQWRVEVGRVTNPAGAVESISYRYVAEVKGYASGNSRDAIVVRWMPGTFTVRQRSAPPTLTGRWSGPYENGRGDKGETCLNLVESNGAITGDWCDPAGWPIQQGRRTGNGLTFYGKSGSKEYWAEGTLSDDGLSMRVTYRVRDSNLNPPQHEGVQFVFFN